MTFSNESCREFVGALASSSPVPGGGGASALVGAVGTALGHMVGSLTVGKKKYLDVQEEILALNAKAQEVQTALLGLIERDAEVFSPLARAYGLPKDTEAQRAEKEAVMAQALEAACGVPMEIMARCCDAISLHAEYAAKGTVMALSDVGVGAAFCRAALIGASLNVFINTKAMTDREKAAAYNQRAEAMLAQYVPLADRLLDEVTARLK